MSLHYRQQGETIILFGNTYPHKEAIKALGGRFNGVLKHWFLPSTSEILEHVRKLCGDDASQASESADDTAGSDCDLVGSPAAESASAPAKPPGRPGSLSVRHLMDKAGVAIASAFPAPVWVFGEIQNIARRGQSYFLELAEGKASGNGGGSLTVKATIWPQAWRLMTEKHGASTLEELLCDGMQICCQAQVSLYKDRGQISLGIDDIDPSYTKGALALAREQLLKELRAKGLDRKNKDLKLAALPFDVGLISAAGSRAASDFTHQLEAGGFCGRLYFETSPMQGEGVPGGVEGAIKRLREKNVDVIVITRGGGSAADLRWFDTKEIALAIATCPVPVVAAIGHHDDVCVAEVICHTRQKTPTAAADFILDCFARVRERLQKCGESLSGMLTRRLVIAVDQQAKLTRGLSQNAARGLQSRFDYVVRQATRLTEKASLRIAGELESLRTLSFKLQSHAQSSLQGRHLALMQMEKGLTQTDPTPWLERGWTRLERQSGRVQTIDSLKVGDRLHARLKDGLLELSVEALVPKTKRRKAAGEKT